jgi:hypothetical protein
VGMFHVSLFLDGVPADIFELLESEFQFFDVISELFAFVFKGKSVCVSVFDLS